MLTRNELKNLWQLLLDSTQLKTHPHTIRLFRGIVSLWVIVGTVILLPAASQFYSLASHIPMMDISQLPDFMRPLYILCDARFTQAYPYFLAAQLVAAVFAGLSIVPRFSSLLLYFFTANLDNRATMIMDGGNNLMHLILVYLIFMSPTDHQRKNTWRALTDNMLSNAGLFVCRLQVVVVYFTAGMLKVTGPLWTKGVALYYTMHVMEYGLPQLADLFSHYPILMVAATYGTLVFQVTFPVMIWFRRYRPLYMAIGTALHLQISLVMGLFSFGLAMCASYFAFYTDAQAARVLSLPSRATKCVADLYLKYFKFNKQTTLTKGHL